MAMCPTLDTRPVIRAILSPPPGKEGRPTSNVHPVTEVCGSSTESIDAAVRGAVSAASKSVRLVEWFEDSEIRGHVTDGAVVHFRAGVKLGVRLES